MYFLLAPRTESTKTETKPTMKQGFNTTHRFANSIVAGIISSFLFLGIGGRLAMRSIAILAEREPRFTVEGTIAVFVFAITIGIVGGALFPIVAQYLPSSRTAKGGTWGLILLVVLIPMLPAEIHHEAMEFENLLALSIVLFGLLFLAFGIVLQHFNRALCLSSHKELCCVVE